jgi:hypothetical protein
MNLAAKTSWGRSRRPLRPFTPYEQLLMPYCQCLYSARASCSATPDWRGVVEEKQNRDMRCIFMSTWCSCLRRAQMVTRAVCLSYASRERSRLGDNSSGYRRLHCNYAEVVQRNVQSRTTQMACLKPSIALAGAKHTEPCDIEDLSRGTLLSLTTHMYCTVLYCSTS